MIKTSCPQCGKEFDFPTEFAGQTGTCSDCGASVAVPVPPGVVPKAARRQTASSSGKKSNTGLWIAVGCGAVFIVFVFFAGIMGAILTPAVFRAQEAAQRSSCQNNLKQMGIVFKMFSNESRKDYYPELSPEPGRLMVDNSETETSAASVAPEYLSDASIMYCPSSFDMSSFQYDDDYDLHLDDQSYLYLGYVVTNQQELEAFARAYKERVAREEPFIDDLKVEPGTGTAGGDTIYRLREGIERFLITDINNPNISAEKQSEIPLLIERPYNHVPNGINVLYMDGHVTFLKIPGEWPATHEAMDILQDLADMDG